MYSVFCWHLWNLTNISDCHDDITHNKNYIYNFLIKNIKYNLAITFPKDYPVLYKLM